MGTARVLTISFELHVPEGLRRDIRGKRLDQAVDRIVGAVQGITPAVFPWADRMTVRRSWSYTWRDELEEFQLPSTIDNTVSEPATPEEGAVMLVGQ
jgi:hypothetical protein